MSGTVTIRDDQGSTYSIRLSGEPEDRHQDILDNRLCAPGVYWFQVILLRIHACLIAIYPALLLASSAKI